MSKVILPSNQYKISHKTVIPQFSKRDRNLVNYLSISNTCPSQRQKVVENKATTNSQVETYRDFAYKGMQEFLS